MRNIKYGIVLFVLLACQANAYAQKDFLKGFVKGFTEGMKKKNEKSSNSSSVQSKTATYGSVSSNNSNNGVKSNASKKRREELGSGGFVIVEEYPTFQIRTRWGLCPNCRGAKICNMCHGARLCTFCKGKGVVISEATGSVLCVCVACNQTGKCKVCEGRGMCECTKYDYPGYAVYEIKQVDNEGNVMFDDKAEYGSKRSSAKSSSSSRNSSRGSCPKCNGRRYDSDDSKYAPASASGWMQPYHNSLGSECPYCGKSYDHYHTPCTECRGFGHT